MPKDSDGRQTGVYIMGDLMGILDEVVGLLSCVLQEIRQAASGEVLRRCNLFRDREKESSSSMFL